MHLAITSDWLTTFGGAEHVIKEMATLWPNAPIFTTMHDPLVSGIRYPVSGLYSSSLQSWYRLVRNHRLLLPWMPRTVESWDLRGYDVIVSSSHAVAKGCIPESSATHICYCHTPMRYAWEMEDQYLEDFRIPRVFRPLVKQQLAKLRRWDRTTAKRVDLFIANSSTTQERIRRIYERESVVLHPPVDDRFFHGQLLTTNCQLPYFLALGRLVPYKRVDLLIETANKMKLPLKIAGSGPDEKRLKKMAGETVEFLGYVPDETLPGLYGSAKAFLFPVEEDAGIAPLEAQACGTPVIAFGKGGALDTVVSGAGVSAAGGPPAQATGLFFQKQTPDALIDALKQFESMTFNPKAIRIHAEQFSSSRFRDKLRGIVTSAHSAQSRKAPGLFPPSSQTETARGALHHTKAPTAPE